MELELPTSLGKQTQPKDEVQIFFNFSRENVANQTHPRITRKGIEFLGICVTWKIKTQGRSWFLFKY